MALPSFILPSPVVGSFNGIQFFSKTGNAAKNDLVYMYFGVHAACV